MHEMVVGAVIALAGIIVGAAILVTSKTDDN